jgi:hypothetical protein
MTVDLVAHFEYFYNTLGCGYATENPFKNAKSFPALTCEVASDPSTQGGSSDGKSTVLEKHRQVIFPTQSKFKVDSS